jgi:hypothetical protein
MLERVVTGHAATIVRSDPLTHEISDRLVISPLTAKSHVRNILRKLDCHDRAGSLDSPTKAD